ncbi:MAG: hypothetical protein AAFV95_27620 [Bacteroidota bacterium]
MRKFIGRFPAVLLLLCGMAACSQFEDFKEVDEVDFQPSIAIPILHSDLSIQEIIDEDDDLSFLEVLPDGQLLLTYESDPTAVGPTELLPILPDFPVVIPEKSTTAPFKPFTQGSVTLMELSSGTLEFQLRSSELQDVMVTVRIPSLKRGGIPFEERVTIQYTGTSPAEANIAPVDVAGYVLESVNDEIQVAYEAQMAGQPVDIEPIVGEARNWTFSTIQGDFDAQTVSLQRDSVRLELFDNWTQGTVSFEDPQLALYIENSFGFPAVANIRRLQAITVDGQVIDFESSLPGNRFEVGHPELSDMGMSRTTRYLFNKDNSNIDDVLNARAQWLVYELDVTFNPEDQNGQTGFVRSDSELSTYVDVELPIYGAASGFEIEESAKFELTDTEDIIEGELKILTDNGIPLGVDLQFYFTNDQDQIVDSLFEDRTLVLPAAQVDLNGDISQVGQATTLVPVSAERLDRMRSYKDIITSARLSTTDNGSRSVRVKADQELNIRMGATLTVDPQ